MAAPDLDRRVRRRRPPQQGKWFVGQLRGRSPAFGSSDAAVDARVADAPTGGYRAEWFRFDNATGASTPIAVTTAQGTRLDMPAAIYFSRKGGTWKLVGLERLPDGEAN